MKVYFIHPALTIGDNQYAENFSDRCCKEMEEHIEVITIRTEEVMLSAEILKEDYIVFFNRIDQLYSQAFSSMLVEAYEKGVEIYPIAITKENRTPPSAVNKAQSFDITDQLRQRRLTESNIATVAFTLARIIVSKMQPTLSREKMHMFISHRRFDGEEVAAAFYNEFIIRAESVFRDLIDIGVGEDAQDVIEKNLRKSDVVIFLDTPKSGESDWIAKELSGALSLNIPIVWVRIDSVVGRVSLKVKPADSPHFELTDLKKEDNALDPELIEAIMHKAFRISRESAKCVFDQIRVLKSIAKTEGVDFKRLDAKNMLYKVAITRSGLRYYQRPLVHILQCFSRLPKEDDREKIGSTLCELGYDNHPVFGPHYDTAILLTPIKECFENVNQSCVTESFDEYLNNLENYLHPTQPTKARKKGIIISGAFPDCEPDHQQYLTDAVFAFTKAIFQKQGVIIFGAHPTFQNLIFSIGSLHSPEDYQRSIHLYISKYFATKGVIDDLEKYAVVNATEDIEKSREKSLSLMRKRMIEDDEAIALICMGGKTRAGGHNPGVDEEIELAKAKGIPVFIIGSAGGRAAELASEYDMDGWKNKLNNMSIEENKELMVSLDYRLIAKKILEALGI